MNPADGHFQAECETVPGFGGNHQISILNPGDFTALQPVGFAPVRNSNAQGVPSGKLCDLDGYRIFPRILCAYLQTDMPFFILVHQVRPDELMDVYAILICRVTVSPHRRQEPDQVGRTAGAAEPGAAMMFADGCERILIEEVIAGKGDTGKDTVIQLPLYNIRVFALTVQQAHPVIPQGHPNGGAGFTVGGQVGFM